MRARARAGGGTVANLDHGVESRVKPPAKLSQDSAIRSIVGDNDHPVKSSHASIAGNNDYPGKSSQSSIAVNDDHLEKSPQASIAGINTHPGKSS